MTSEPEQPDQGEAAKPGRRSFLRGMAGGVAGGVIAGGVAGGFAGYAARGTAADPAAAADAAAVKGRLPAVPFHGKYQAGILPQPRGPPPWCRSTRPPPHGRNWSTSSRR